MLVRDDFSDLWYHKSVEKAFFSDEFFKQLGIFSDRLSDIYNYQQYTSWRSIEAETLTAVIHYTADTNFERVMKWFCRPSYNARASSEFVVAADRRPYHSQLAVDLPLVEALPVTVGMTVHPAVLGRQYCWHARTFSKYGVGIENVCSGMQTENSMTPEKEVVEIGGNSWETYTEDQIVTNAIVLSACLDYGVKINPSLILGHECVQSILSDGTDKRDPGPVYPMNELRNCLSGIPAMLAPLNNSIFDLVVGAADDRKVLLEKLYFTRGSSVSDDLELAVRNSIGLLGWPTRSLTFDLDDKAVFNYSSCIAERVLGFQSTYSALGNEGFFDSDFYQKTSESFEFRKALAMRLTDRYPVLYPMEWLRGDK